MGTQCRGRGYHFQLFNSEKAPVNHHGERQCLTGRGGKRTEGGSRKSSLCSAFRIRRLCTDAWDLGGDRLGGCIRDEFKPSVTTEGQPPAHRFQEPAEVFFLLSPRCDASRLGPLPPQCWSWTHQTQEVERPPSITWGYVFGDMLGSSALPPLALPQFYSNSWGVRYTLGGDLLWQCGGTSQR